MTKIEYVLEFFPEVATTDPHNNRALVMKVKEAMLRDGFYKTDFDSLYDLVFNLLLKARGEFKYANRGRKKRKETSSSGA